MKFATKLIELSISPAGCSTVNANVNVKCSICQSVQTTSNV